MPILSPCAAAITNRNWIRLARCAGDVGDEGPVPVPVLEEGSTT
mgnify:CR=1 FL=1